jgi:hypothetical protein
MNQPNATMDKFKSTMVSEQHKTTILSHDTPSSYANTALEGSTARMNQCLQELVELTGQQHNGTASVPVLELQLGEVVTITSLLMDATMPSLSITALLPRREQTDNVHLPPSSQKGMPTALADGSECLWHADEGRYVVIRQVPIAELQDAERSVLDAILDTSDQAALWFAAICTPPTVQ